MAKKLFFIFFIFFILTMPAIAGGRIEADFQLEPAEERLVYSLLKELDPDKIIILSVNNNPAIIDMAVIIKNRGRGIYCGRGLGGGNSRVIAIKMAIAEIKEVFKEDNMPFLK